MTNPIRAATAKVAEKIPKPIVNAVSPWTQIPGAETAMRALVLFAPIPPLLKPALAGYIDGVTAPKAAAIADGVTKAVA